MWKQIAMPTLERGLCEQLERGLDGHPAFVVVYKALTEPEPSRAHIIRSWENPRHPSPGSSLPMPAVKALIEKQAIIPQATVDPERTLYRLNGESAIEKNRAKAVEIVSVTLERVAFSHNRSLSVRSILAKNIVDALDKAGLLGGAS